MINLNDYYFHFTNGSVRDKNQVSISLKHLASILKSGYILSRNKQIETLGYFNEGFKNANWNGFDYVSICQIQNNINDEFVDEDENAFQLFCNTNSICLILNKELLYEALRRKYYWHMQGEIQIKNQISSKYFEGIGIKLDDYFVAQMNHDTKTLKDILEKDKKIILLLKKMLEEYNIDLPIISLNDGDEAINYLQKIKVY